MQDTVAVALVCGAHRIGGFFSRPAAGQTALLRVRRKGFLPRFQHLPDFQLMFHGFYHGNEPTGIQKSTTALQMFHWSAPISLVRISCIPPSAIVLAETTVNLVLFWNSLIFKAPHVLIVAFIFAKVTPKLSFILPV